MQSIPLRADQAQGEPAPQFRYVLRLTPEQVHFLKPEQKEEALIELLIFINLILAVIYNPLAREASRLLALDLIITQVRRATRRLIGSVTEKSPTYAPEIEKRLGLSRNTISSGFTLLEKAGMIHRSHRTDEETKREHLDIIPDTTLFTAPGMLQDKKKRAEPQPKPKVAPLEAHCPSCRSGNVNTVCRDCGSIEIYGIVNEETDVTEAASTHPKIWDGNIEHRNITNFAAATTRDEQITVLFEASEPESSEDGMCQEEHLPDVAQVTGSEIPFDLQAEDIGDYDILSSDDMSTEEQQKPSFQSTEQAGEYVSRMRERFAEGMLKELQPYRHWIVWQHQGEQKVPYNPVAYYQASSLKPATWGTLDQALRALETGRFAGLGFMLDPKRVPLTFVDLDHVFTDVSKQRPTITDIADQRVLDIVHDLRSYTELSPSGEGLHIYAYGLLPGNRKTSLVEMYKHGRYFTLTGEHLAGTPFTIEHRPSQINKLYEAHKPCEADLRQIPVLPMARSGSFLTELPPAAQRDPELARLLRGDTSKEDGDESRALFKLVLKLLHYSDNDIRFTREQVLSSPLGQRDKILEKRGKTDYLNMTIYNALRFQRNPPMKRQP